MGSFFLRSMLKRRARCSIGGGTQSRTLEWDNDEYNQSTVVVLDWIQRRRLVSGVAEIRLYHLLITKGPRRCHIEDGT